MPSSRLLLLVAVVAVPFSAAAPGVPAARLPAAMLIGALVLLALGDLLLSCRALAGVLVEMPEAARMNKDAEGSVELRLRSERRPLRSLRVGLPLPMEFASPDEALETALPESGRAYRLKWACTPLRRGRYTVSICCLETGSAAGLWRIQKRCAMEGEIRVYPNLKAERQRVAALFLNRDNPGIHRSPQVGRGREFEKLRDYLPGDSFQDVHWKATAKRGHPVTKIFQTERTQEVVVIVDASRLSGRPLAGSVPASESPLGDDTLLERFVVSALMLNLAAEQQGDQFGLLTFSDRVQRYLKPGRGKAHYNACRDTLYTLQPEIVTPDFEELAGFIRTRIRKRALLLFLTHLDDPVLAEQFLRGVELICRTHLVMVIMPRPPGCAPLFESPVDELQEVYERLGSHILWHRLKETGQDLRHRGVQFDLVDQASLSTLAVSRYMEVKHKQLL